jgi:LmeA-like phospholipid-binding
VFRRFLIAILLFLIVVVVAVDRVGAIVGAHVLASKLQTDERLDSRPDTSIGGFPFLTQAAGGKYKNVAVTARDVTINNLSVTTLTVHLHGVHLPFGKVLGGSVARVPVDHVNGTAFLSFVDANGYLAAHGPTGATILLSAGSGNTAAVFEMTRLHGKSVSLHGLGSLTLANNRVTIAIRSLTPSTGSLAGRPIKVPARLLRVTLPLEGLPFRIRLTSISVSSTGVSATGAASKIVLGS